MNIFYHIIKNNWILTTKIKLKRKLKYVYINKQINNRYKSILMDTKYAWYIKIYKRESEKNREKGIE